MRKLIHPGQSISLLLTAEERRLLAEDCLVIDNTYLDRVREATKPEVPFTLDELEDLSGQVAFEANHSKKGRKQKALDNLFEKIKHVLDAHTDDEETAKTEPSEEITLAGLDPKRLDLLRLLMIEMDALGFDAHALAESLTPKIVNPHDKLPVRMSAAQRELVLGLSDLDEQVRREISQAPQKQRTVPLTLRQVTALENRVAAAAASCGDRKLSRKWQDIDHNLTEVQTHYADGTEPQNAVGELLAGKPVPKAVAARQLLLKLLEKQGR